MVQQYGVGLFKYLHICFIGNNARKKGNKSEYDIIQKIFKSCESNMYLIVLLHIIKRVHDKIDLIKK